MKQNSLARNYVEAICSFVENIEEIVKLHQETSEIWDLCVSSTAYHLLICKKAAISDKLLIWERIKKTTENRFAPLTLVNIEFIIKRKIFHLIPQIISNLREKLLVAQNILELEVTVAEDKSILAPAAESKANVKADSDLVGSSEPQSPLAKRIQQQLQQFTGAQLKLRLRVDPSVIGGLKLRVGNKIFDHSVHNQLQALLK